MSPYSSNPTPEELARKLVLTCRMTDEMLRNMSPADRDRMLQTHLAAVRGPARNFALVCQATDALMDLHRERSRQGGSKHG